jgi:CheY-like chemotaxis protein
MLRRLIGEDVVIETSLDPALSLVRADVGQIEQVLINLAVNARDAMPHGGALRIETLNVQLDAPVATERETIPAGDYVRLVVADTGEGIPATVLPHIFEPFFTTKDVGKGTGLGLATVYGIIRQLGGYVAVASTPGRGAALTIYLPAAASSPAPSVSEASLDEVPRGDETVLVVEDDDGVRRLATDMLRMQGYTVLDACNGEDALKCAEEHDGPIALLLTDVIMPGMNGRELAERLTATRPGLKVLFVSGYTDDQVLRRDILGAEVAFLQKPFTIDSLIRKVSETIGS